MSSGIERRVAHHYTHGGLEQAILAGLAASGVDQARVTPADLAPVDEFHIGGRPATADFAEQLEFAPGSELLDVGSGLGGASRYFAQERGCRVTGIDVTPEYVSVANVLAVRVGLSGMATYRQASALDLPFGAASFDGAYMFHVGMNIEDKHKLFAEIRRVLKPQGVFGIYDVMREAEGDLDFPVPWATGAETALSKARPTTAIYSMPLGSPCAKPAIDAISRSNSLISFGLAQPERTALRRSACIS
jgi:SAM-dependent methyltransferase